MNESITRVDALEIKFSAPVAGGFSVEISAEKTANFQASPAQMWVKNDQAKHFVCLSLDQSDVTRLSKDREDALTSEITEVGDVYSIDNQLAYSSIEKIIFINKTMLKKHIDNVPDWFFGRLRLKNFDFDRNYDVGLRLNSITGIGLASSDVYLDSSVSGDLVFVPRN